MVAPLIHLSFNEDVDLLAKNAGSVAVDGTFDATPTYIDSSTLKGTSASPLGVRFGTGSAQHISFPLDSGFLLTGDFTMAGWVKATTTSGANGMLQSTYNGGIYGAMVLLAGTWIRMYYGYGTGTTSEPYFIGGTLANAGFHYCFRYKASTNTFRLSINNVEVVNKVLPNTLVHNIEGHFGINQYRPSSVNYEWQSFTGVDVVDELYMFNYEITDADLTKLYVAPVVIGMKPKLQQIIKATANPIKFNGLGSLDVGVIPTNNYNFTYRITKGIPLTNKEIDENFKVCSIYATNKPRFSGGFVVNHIPGTLYLGDIVVNDLDGSYTGSGDCWAIRDGYSMSEKAVAP